MPATATSKCRSFGKPLSLTPRGITLGRIWKGGVEVRRYAEAIHGFDSVPYLRSSNVIILSPAPGSIAGKSQVRGLIFFQNEFLAPLSRRIYNRFESMLVSSAPISYGEFLHPILDVKPSGEIRTYGTTTWSDFSVIRQIEMFKKNRAVAGSVF